MSQVPTCQGTHLLSQVNRNTMGRTGEDGRMGSGMGKKKKAVGGKVRGGEERNDGQHTDYTFKKNSFCTRVLHSSPRI